MQRAMIELIVCRFSANAADRGSGQLAVVSQTELILQRQEWKRNGKRVVCVAGALICCIPGTFVCWNRRVGWATY